MAVSQAPEIRSFKSATTLSTGSQYKIAFMTAGMTAGTVAVGDPGTTAAAAKPIGVYYGNGTQTTTTDREAIPVAIGGILKLRMAASTVTVGELIAMSSDGLGCTPTTNMWVVGRQLSGSSGAVNRIVEVLWFGTPLRYEAILVSTT
jgi:hypothetical protein